ncbi:hypothetical protein ACEQ8H_000249, partial [Pleosporales sp. CAS-2024a]
LPGACEDKATLEYSQQAFGLMREIVQGCNSSMGFRLVGHASMIVAGIPPVLGNIASRVAKRPNESFNAAGQMTTSGRHLVPNARAQIDPAPRAASGGYWKRVGRQEYSQSTRIPEQFASAWPSQGSSSALRTRDDWRLQNVERVVRHTMKEAS